MAFGRRALPRRPFPAESLAEGPSGPNTPRKKSCRIGTNSSRRTLYRAVGFQVRAFPAQFSNKPKGLGMTSTTDFTQTGLTEGLADGFIKAPPKTTRRGFAAMDENLRRLIA